MTEATQIIGVDPSITATGVAAGWGTATIPVLRGSEKDKRLATIYRYVNIQLLTPPGETLVLIEDLPTHAHGAGITGMVHGVIRLALLRAEVPYVLVPPATLKKYATGRGNANKSDMRMALFQRTGVDLVDDNQVDAWWLRQMGLDAVSDPGAVQLPRVQREAMLKVAWPETIAANLLKPYEKVVT